jgi:hypothetical protein
MRAVLSWLPEIRDLPSFEGANEVTVARCPSSVFSSFPVATSHVQIEPSWRPEINTSPF